MFSLFVCLYKTHHGQQHRLQASPRIMNYYHKTNPSPKKEKKKEKSLLCVHVCFIHNISSSSIHSIFPFSTQLCMPNTWEGLVKTILLPLQTSGFYKKESTKKNCDKGFLWKKAPKSRKIYLKSPYLDNRSPKYNKILFKYIFPLWLVVKFG